ncbi:MAG: hypothetical protein K8L99_10820 [Anaerolineae bacterium]|nr:hypothetical protein [Anaerolineae bacterium]
MEVVILLVLFALVVAVMLSPLESLSWWAGWYGSADDDLHVEMEGDVSDAPSDETAEKLDAYVVYLTGVGGFSNTFFLPEERALLDHLAAALPRARLVDDVYPYAVTESNLDDGRIFSWFWRRVIRQKELRRPTGFLINIRNMLQVLVAADSRYSPIYSRGMASIVLKALNRHNYPFGSRIPVVLIGYSGGGEMAISTITPLKRALAAPVYVISLGGVLSSDPYLADVEHLYHLRGNKDRVQMIGSIVFPGRWRWAWLSAWNKIRQAGKVSIVPMGPVAHHGQGGYLDDHSTLPDGRSHLEATVQALAEIINNLSAPVEALPAESPVALMP